MVATCMFLEVACEAPQCKQAVESRGLAWTGAGDLLTQSEEKEEKAADMHNLRNTLR